MRFTHLQYVRLKFSFYCALAGVAIIAPILLVFASATLPEGLEWGALIVYGNGVVLAVLVTALVLRATYTLGFSQAKKIAPSEPNNYGGSQATRLPTSLLSTDALTRYLMPYKAVRIEVLDDDGAMVRQYSHALQTGDWKDRWWLVALSCGNRRRFIFIPVGTS